MLVRRDEASLILIPQPCHSWLSGQLARAWGGTDFEPPSPFEAVCLAVEQHDIGWLDWDQRPQLDSKTGLPREFWTVPAVDHTAFWSDGVRRALVFGRYPALLVSLHGTTIYALTFDPSTASRDNAEAVKTFLAEQRLFQQTTLSSLRADPSTADDATADNVERNRLLVRALDAMSLHACWGLQKEVVITDVPSSGEGCRSLTLRPGSAQPDEIIVDPWPFRSDRLVLKAEGKRVAGPFRTDDDLQRAFEAAQSVMIPVALRSNTAAAS
jgi:hypothetical protein